MELILLCLVLLALALSKLVNELTKFLRQLNSSTSGKLLNSGNTLKAEFCFKPNDIQKNEVCASHTNSKTNDCGKD